MQLTNTLIALAMASTAYAQATVKFYITKEATCGGSASQEYRNVRCNSCVDPPGDWWGGQVSGIGSNQRVSYHNQNNCTPGSQVGQWYGNTCARAGNTALRSIWVACAGQRTTNGTEIDDGAEQVVDLD